MIKITDLNKSDNHSIIKLNNNLFFDKQREAGKIVASTLVLLKNIVNDNYSKYSLIELNSIAENFIYSNNAQPTFKGYKGFPYGVCISVNENVVHGIPTNDYLKSGDVVSFDLGATVDGVIADSALTIIVDQPKSERHIELIKANEECLMAGINAIKVGLRLGVIGDAISRYTKKSGFASITAYGGHGLGDLYNPHASPFVPNVSTPNEGIRIQNGLSLAIEPQLVDAKTNETRILSDGWTVKANGISSHFEHSICIYNDCIEILTDRSGL